MTTTPWPKAIGFFTDYCLLSTALTLSVPCTSARPADPNPYTRYWVLLSKFTQALMALL